MHGFDFQLFFFVSLAFIHFKFTCAAINLISFSQDNQKKNSQLYKSLSMPKTAHSLNLWRVFCLVYLPPLPGTHIEFAYRDLLTIFMSFVDNANKIHTCFLVVAIQTDINHWHRIIISELIQEAKRKINWMKLNIWARIDDEHHAKRIELITNRWCLETRGEQKKNNMNKRWECVSSIDSVQV